MIAFPHQREREILSENLRRIMMQRGLTVNAVRAATGLDKRTIRKLLLQNARVHATTIHKLSEGLGVPATSLLHDSSIRARCQDAERVVGRFIARHSRLFREWRQEDLDDLAAAFALP